MEQAQDALELQLQLSEIMGLEIPTHVAERALTDTRFRYHLIAAKSNPAWVQQLIDLVPVPEQPPPRHSALNLGLKLAASVARHALAGFKRADPQVLDRRWTACQSCPHLVTPPDSMVYHLGRRIVAGEGEDERVCSLCGCFALPKARKPTEVCPAPEPNSPHLTRWEEPRHPL